MGGERSLYAWKGWDGMETKTREAIAPAYKWRLTDIYETDAAWEAELDSLGGLTDQVAGFAGRLAEARAFKDCLAAYVALSMRLERVYMYAKMGQDLDNASPKAQSMVDRRRRRWSGCRRRQPS